MKLVIVCFALVCVAIASICGDGCCDPTETKSSCSSDCPYDIKRTHPRIFFSDFSALQSQARSTNLSLYIAWKYFLEDIYNNLDEPTNTVLKIHNLVNTYNLRYSKYPRGLALAGVVDDIPDFRNRCTTFVDELLNVPYDYGTDYNQGSRIESLGYIYDWMYHYLTETQRQSIRQAILKGFDGSALVYDLNTLPYIAYVSAHQRAFLSLVAIYGDGGSINMSSKLKSIVNHHLGSGGILEYRNFESADGSHFFGSSYCDYNDPQFEMVWDTATNEAKVTQNWRKLQSKWYIYSLRQTDTAKWNYPLSGDFWGGTSDTPEAVVWNAKNFRDPLLAWFYHKYAANKPYGLLDVIGNYFDDGNIADLSKNKFQGVMTPSTTWTKNHGTANSVCVSNGNKVGGSLSFKYPTSGLLIPLICSNTIAFPQTQGTIAFWLHNSTFQQTSAGRLFDRYDKSRNHIYISLSGSSIEFAAQQGSTVWNNIGHPDLTREWHFIGLSWQMGGKLLSLVDLTSSDSVTIGNNTWTPSEQVVTVGQKLTGIIDDITILDSALSVSQMQSFFIQEQMITLPSGLTKSDETWIVCICPSDRSWNGATVCSSELQITSTSCEETGSSTSYLGVSVSIQPNYSSSSSSCVGISLSANISGSSSSEAKYSIQWYRNSTQFTFLTMPMDGSPPSIGVDPSSYLTPSGYFPNSGFVYMRTSWNWENYVHVTFKSTPYWYGNHQHLDENNILVYYKGSLLTESGNYEPPGCGTSHWWNYYRRTIAHNNILIYDPSETFEGYCNDGGQTWTVMGDYPTLDRVQPGGTNSLGGILIHHEETRFTFSRGDATKAYAPKKMKEFTRDVLFIRPTSSTMMGTVLIVYDRVQATNSTYKKTLLWHMIDKPTITNGNQITITNGSGQLKMSILLPESIAMSTVGGIGNEYTCEGINYGFSETATLPEAGHWRVEVNPMIQSIRDTFFSVMDIGLVGSQTTSKVLLSFPSKNFDGVLINNKLVAVFSTISSSLPQTIDETVLWSISESSQIAEIFITGLSTSISFIGHTINNTHLHFWSSNSVGTIVSSDGTVFVNLSNETSSNDYGCIPTITCNSLGYICGTAFDDCGNALDCGNCLNAQVCQNGKCVPNDESNENKVNSADNNYFSLTLVLLLQMIMHQTK